MPAPYDGPERRGNWRLSEDEIEAIAERAAEKALEKIFADVGRTALKKLGFFLTLAVLGLLSWLAGTGHIKLE